MLISPGMLFTLVGVLVVSFLLSGWRLVEHGRPWDVRLPILHSGTELASAGESIPFFNSAGCTNGCPIWAHDASPLAHEVLLFRRTFVVDQPVNSAELQIFADTRYEVWLDGAWVGRGPARFSTSRREYDVYSLDALPVGEHLVAILVQWSPNKRRSESTVPFLQAALQAVQGDSGVVDIVQTDETWKVHVATAWKFDAALVHSWGLIGSTELLDLQALPRDWMALAYSDTQWDNAVLRSGGTLAEQPRSIPLLVSVPVTPTVLDAGLLSPNRLVGEWQSSPSGVATLDFAATIPTVFTVEMPADSEASLAEKVFLDTHALVWQAAESRPDVFKSSVWITAGAHQLQFNEIPAAGKTFAVSTSNVDIEVPFQQGVHAGRRLLLAEPFSQVSSVGFSMEPDLGITFQALPAYVVLDLGRTVHGRLRLDVTGPAGTVLDIGWDERLWNGTRPLPYPGSLHPEWNQVDSWVLDGTPRSISTLDTRAGRYVLIAVWGASGPVQLNAVQVHEERYPVESRGSFSTSASELDAIWQVGVDSLYPNMTDAYTDTPWRERGQWWGDAYVENYVNRVAFGDTQLLRRGLLFVGDAFADGVPQAMAPSDGGNMLDYGMLWVQGLQDYWEITAETQFLVELYPTLLEFMNYLASYEYVDTGLLDLPRGHWSQTALIDWPAYHSRYGQSTALNALYYGTLVDASQLAAAVGEVEQSQVWQQKADSVREQINIHLYDASAHCYQTTIYDGEVFLNAKIEQDFFAPLWVLPQGMEADSCAPHAQAWALAYDVVPDAEVHAVADSLLASLSSDPAAPNVEIYGMFWVLKGLGAAERTTAALYVLEQYYGRLLDLGATTWWEGFNAHLSYTASLSHAWGGAPTWFLSTYILGARQVAANSWLLVPPFAGAQYASGTLPLQDGILEVAWAAERCENLTVDFTAPLGSTGEVVLPVLGASSVVTLNEELVWDKGISLADEVESQSDGLHILVESGGSYALQIHRTCYEMYLPLLYSSP